MDIHRAESIKKELRTFGRDIMTGNVDDIIVAVSETTNLQKLEIEIREAADHYAMRVKSLNEHRCELVGNKK